MVKEFREGFIKYETRQEQEFSGLNLNEWQDGYLSFSTREVRLRDALAVSNNLSNLISKKNPLPGCEGYLMEFDLWREENGVYEELSAEREDVAFFIQRWKLITNPENGGEGMKCYWREADTMPRSLAVKSGLFGADELKTIEVIVPERRLHFFITKKAR